MHLLQRKARKPLLAEHVWWRARRVRRQSPRSRELASEPADDVFPVVDAEWTRGLGSRTVVHMLRRSSNFTNGPLVLCLGLL